MKYSFEIRDEKGNVTKNGIMSDGEKIPFDTTDFYYIIRSTYYPYDTIKEGLVPKKKKQEDNMYPVKYMHELNGKVLVMTKGRVLFEHNGKSIEGENITQLNASKGSNLIRLKNGDTLEFRSEQEKADDQVMSSAYNEQQVRVGEKICRFSGKASGIEKVVEYIKFNEKDMDDDELYSAYLILNRIELKENMRCKWNSNTKWSISNDIHGYIEGEEIDSFNVYEVSNNIRTFIGSYDLNKVKSVDPKENTYVIVDGYKGKEYISSRIKAGVPGRVKSIAWKKDREVEEMYQRAIERGKLTASQLKDIEEFVRVYSSFNNINRIIDAPKLISTSNSSIEMDIKEIDIINNLGKKCYLSFSTIKNFNSDYLLNKILIEGESIFIDKFAKAIDDSDDIVVWIETEDGIVISDITAVYVNDEDLYKATELETHFSRINEQRIIGAIKEVDPIGYQEIMREMINNAYNDQSVGRIDVCTNIIHQMIQRRMFDSSWPIFKSALNLRSNSVSTSDKFFNKDITISAKRKELTVPDERNCLLIVEKYDPKSNSISTLYTENRTIKLTNEFTIVRFLDRNLFEYSGHIVISNGKVLSSDNFIVRAVG